MNELRRAGWRMRTAFSFVRSGEALYLAADGTWRHLGRDNRARRVGRTLAEAEAALCPAEYLAVMEAVR